MYLCVQMLDYLLLFQFCVSVICLSQRIAKKMLLAQIKSNYSSGAESSSDNEEEDVGKKSSKKAKKEEDDEEEQGRVQDEIYKYSSTRGLLCSLFFCV